MSLEVFNALADPLMNWPEVLWSCRVDGLRSLMRRDVGGAGTYDFYI